MAARPWKWPRLRPDIILLDIDYLDGIAACRQLRELPGSSRNALHYFPDGRAEVLE
jgi:CheY-like chemotaxis protein